jgi:CRISPR-associated protein Cmr1
MEHETENICGVLARLQIITPMFLGGAVPEAELRVPSIKAMLRFWHRAVDPGFSSIVEPHLIARESALWGGTERNAGQSKVLLTITEQALQRINWGSLDAERRRFNEGEGRKRKNGLGYLGYPFDFPQNKERTAFAPKGTFTLRLTVRRGSTKGSSLAIDETEARTVVASLWMLGHLGALGSRSRRGFGALALLEWDTFGPVQAELRNALDALPLLVSRSGPDAWKAGVDEVRQKMRGWFGEYEPGALSRMPHPHWGEHTRLAMLEPGFAANQWPEALNALGRKLQDFRVRSEPDYSIAKDHLRALAQRALAQRALAHDGGQFMRAAPGRVTFGLPLTFRFGSLSTNPSDVTLVPYEQSEQSVRREQSGRGEQKERQPSMLFARLVPLSGRVHPLFLRLTGAVPGFDGGPSVGDRRANRGGLPAAHHALDEFMDSLE